MHLCVRKKYAQIRVIRGDLIINGIKQIQQIPMRGVFLSPRITRITRNICVIRESVDNIKPLRLCVRQENNIAHRIHKIHRMSSSAWSESETNRNSVCSVLSVCKQIRVDSRDTLEINNQRDSTDETDSLRVSHLTGTDVRCVRPS